MSNSDSGSNYSYKLEDFEESKATKRKKNAAKQTKKQNVSNISGCNTCELNRSNTLPFTKLDSDIIKLVNISPVEDVVKLDFAKESRCSYISIEHSPILALEWFRPGYILCACENSSYLYLLEFTRIPELKIFKTYKLTEGRTISCMSAGSTLAAIGCSSGQIILFHLDKLEFTAPILQLHSSICTAIDFSHVNSSLLCAGYESGHVAIFQTLEQSPLVTCLPLDVPITVIKFLPASSTILAISYHLVRELWIYNTQSNYGFINKMDNYVLAMQSRSHSPYLYCAMDEKIRVNEQSYIKAVNFLKYSHSISSYGLSGHIMCLDTSELCKFIICGTSVGDVYLIDTFRQTKKKFTLKKNQLNQIICRVMYISNNEDLSSDFTSFELQSYSKMAKRGYLNLSIHTSKIAKEKNIKNYSLVDDRCIFLNCIMKVQFCPGDASVFVIGTQSGMLIVINTNIQELL